MLFPHLLLTGNNYFCTRKLPWEGSVFLGVTLW